MSQTDRRQRSKDAMWICNIHIFHWAVADYLQRAARHIAAKTDVDQVYAVGTAEVELGLKGENAIIPTIERSTVPAVGDRMFTLCAFLSSAFYRSETRHRLLALCVGCSQSHQRASDDR